MALLEFNVSDLASNEEEKKTPDFSTGENYGEF